jgi:hypothetical protein
MKLRLKCEYVRETSDGVEFEVPGIEPLWLVGVEELKMGVPNCDRGRELTREERRDLEMALDSFADRRLAAALTGFLRIA